MLRPLVKLPLDDDACGRLWAAFCAVQGVARSWRHTGSVHTPSSSLSRGSGMSRGHNDPVLAFYPGALDAASGLQRLFSLDPDTGAATPSLWRSR